MEMMKVLALVAASCFQLVLWLASAPMAANGYSLRDATSRTLGQKSIVDHTLRSMASTSITQRDTIRMMPNQTPMVPYKVRARVRARVLCSFCFALVHCCL